jgi:hypothetical protein
MPAPITQLLNGRDMRVLFSAAATHDRYVVATPSPVRDDEVRVSVTNSAGTIEGNGSYLPVTDGSAIESEMLRLWRLVSGQPGTSFPLVRHAPQPA